MSSWLAAFILTQALDAGSSCLAYSRGYVEAVPWMPAHCGAVVALKGASVPAVLLLTKDKPKARKIALIVGTVAVGVFVVHNMVRMR